MAMYGNGNHNGTGNCKFARCVAGAVKTDLKSIFKMGSRVTQPLSSQPIAGKAS